MFFLGQSCTTSLERDKLVINQGDKTTEIPWTEIRMVTTDDRGATLHLAKGTELVPQSVVWYEFVVEDIIEKARQANPHYEGPPPSAKPRSLEIPGAHQEQMNYIRRAQRFYKDRCPSYDELKAFLEANPDWEFDETTYYECSMAMCSGSPVGEGYNTDLKIPDSEKWYFEFEKQTGHKPFAGRDLLKVLNSIPRPA